MTKCPFSETLKVSTLNLLTVGKTHCEHSISRSCWSNFEWTVNKRLHLQQQQQEQELPPNLQQQEAELRLRLHERALENEKEKKKADAVEELKLLKLELTNRCSRASGSVADEIESDALKVNNEKTTGWTKSLAQRSVPSRPLSPDGVIDPPTNVTPARDGKRFSAYPKTCPLFQPGLGIFLAKLTEPRFSWNQKSTKELKWRIRKRRWRRRHFSSKKQSHSKTETEVRAPHKTIGTDLPRVERNKVNQTNSQVICQPLESGGASDLQKVKFVGSFGQATVVVSVWCCIS